MITLLLVGVVPLVLASSPSNDPIGKWTVYDGNGKPCIKMNAQITFSLNYINDDDALSEVGKLVTVPTDATSVKSSCYEKVQIGDNFIDSQVLHLEFPHNEGWNVRIAFTQDGRMGVAGGDWALWQVNVTANYSSMPEVFENARPGHVHTYFSVIDFIDPPEIADDEYTRVGFYMYCPSAQSYIINEDLHNGPSASVTLQNVQMQAYMRTDDFGKKFTCPADQTDVDLVPVIVSGVLAALVLFTLITYFVYRSRLPTDILDLTEPEFEDEHHHHKEDDHHTHLNNNHDNHGFHEDHRF